MRAFTHCCKKPVKALARAAVSLLGLQPGLIEHEARDGAVYDLQHRRHRLGLRGQQQKQRNRQPNLAIPHPLAHRHARNDLIDQVGRRLRHAPRLLHQAIQRGLLGAVALVVDRGAVRRPDRRVRLPANGLHARLPRL